MQPGRTIMPRTARRHRAASNQRSMTSMASSTVTAVTWRAARESVRRAPRPSLVSSGCRTRCA